MRSSGRPEHDCNATPFATANLNGPTGLAFDRFGNLFVSNVSQLANPVDTFAGAGGESSAREFGTLGYSIRARKPA